MTQPINLNKMRKDKARSEAKAKADSNAAKFGMSKAQRVLAATQASQAQKRLSQLEFEDE